MEAVGEDVEGTAADGEGEEGREVLTQEARSL